MTLARIAARCTFAFVTAGLAVGCGGGEPEAATPAATSEPAPAAPPPAPAAESPKPAASAEPAKPAEEPLTDERIAAILDAANGGEIEQAKLVAKNGKDAKVKAFATHMIADHGKNQTDSKAVLKKNNIVPAESQISLKLQQDSQQLVAKLGNEKGAEFDKDYIDAQVAEHQAVLDMIDQKLLVQVKNADLKAGITAFRPKVEHHLGDAKTIQAGLAAAPPPKK